MPEEIPLTRPADHPHQHPARETPYDLPHSARSTCLCAGADQAEAAQRSGNSVEAFLPQYAKCQYHRQPINYQRIEGPLSATTDGPRRTTDGPD